MDSASTAHSMRSKRSGSEVDETIELFIIPRVVFLTCFKVEEFRLPMVTHCLVPDRGETAPPGVSFEIRGILHSHSFYKIFINLYLRFTSCRLTVPGTTDRFMKIRHLAYKILQKKLRSRNACTIRLPMQVQN